MKRLKKFFKTHKNLLFEFAQDLGLQIAIGSIVMLIWMRFLGGEIRIGHIVVFCLNSLVIVLLSMYLRRRRG